MDTSPLNTALMRLSKRAESYDRDHLVASFVNIGSMFTVLSNPDHQVVYGRRGTGKTHALAYLSDKVNSSDGFCFSIDMRTIGSTGGLYSDPALPLQQRATRLLVDTLQAIHDSLMSFCVENAEQVDLSQIGPKLDDFAAAVAEVRVTGPIETEELTNSMRTNRQSATASLSNSPALGISGETESQLSLGAKVRRSGEEQHRIHFGTVRSALSDVIAKLAPRRLWILLDEWSEVPLDLQPLLADLLRRSIFPVANITVKIAAIEHRSKFRIRSGDGSAIGIELGADIATAIDLDEYMVFDNDAAAAMDFFANLLFRHVLALQQQGLHVSTSEILIQHAFTQHAVFEEFTRAAEGVPRDAINILALAAQKANASKISVADVRHAAKSWYSRSKQKAVADDEQAIQLLNFIIDKVIGHRQARAFLVRSDVRHYLIDLLFDARVLHLIKPGVSTHDQPGVRYNAYAIDYGCYVDLINTNKAPRGLFEAKTASGESFVQVPANDYRSIRRAILDLADFDSHLNE